MVNLIKPGLGADLGLLEEVEGLIVDSGSLVFITLFYFTNQFNGDGSQVLFYNAANVVLTKNIWIEGVGHGPPFYMVGYFLLEDKANAGIWQSRICGPGSVYV